MALTDEDKQWLRGEIQHAREEIVTDLREIEAHLKEYTDQRAEVIETRLLRAFRQFAHPVEARLRASRMAMQVYDAELDALKERIEALEDKPGAVPPS